MKRLLRLLIVIMVMAIVVSAVGRFVIGKNVLSVYRYSDSSRYSAGSGYVEASKVRAIELDWVAGSIDILEGDVSKVTFEERSSKDLNSKNCMYWYLDGDTLRIKWCKSGLSNGAISHAKDLTVIVPRGTFLNKLTVNSTSSNIRILADSNDYLINSVSGSILIDDGQGAEKVSVNSVSGSVDLSFAVCPDKVTVDIVSGNTVLSVPGSSGFTAKLSSVSGRLSCDIPAVMKDGKYTVGDGKASVKVESVSGSVTIKAN